MSLPPVRSWTTDPTFRLLARCDRCHRRRLFAPYFEVYGTVDEDHLAQCGPCKEKQPRIGGRLPTVWWWECYLCLVDTITAIAEDRRPVG